MQLPLTRQIALQSLVGVIYADAVAVLRNTTPSSSHLTTLSDTTCTQHSNGHVPLRAVRAWSTALDICRRMSGNQHSRMSAVSCEGKDHAANSAAVTAPW